MKFTHTPEQQDFARTLERLLDNADTVAANRAWAAGDLDPGRALWQRLAEQGASALLVPDEHDGMGASPVELVIALEAIGRHAVPGPWIETAAYLPTALDDAALLGELAAGSMATVVAAPWTPYAVDGAVAEHRLVLSDGTLHRAEVGEAVTSVDRSRRLSTLTATGGQVATGDVEDAFDLAALATAAELLGAGERILADSVAYVKQRRQFGREIGSYQAIKHQLADVRIALDFARPLIQGAALSHGTELFARDVSAARVHTNAAAHRAARVGLQVHGAIGYTLEFDLSLWLTRVRALVSAWGTTSFHRERVLSSLVGA